MYLGKIVEMASAEDFFARPLHPYTEVLLSAIYIADPDQKTNRKLMLGDIPSPINPPSGCRFHTRCRYAQADLQRYRTNCARPAGHRVACHFAETLTSKASRPLRLKQCTPTPALPVRRRSGVKPRSRKTAFTKSRNYPMSRSRRYFDAETGALLRLTNCKTGWNVQGRAELGNSFEAVVPIPERLLNVADGTRQKAAGRREAGQPRLGVGHALAPAHSAPVEHPA